MRKKKHDVKPDNPIKSEKKDDKWAAVRTFYINEKEDDNRRLSISIKNEKDKISQISDKSNKKEFNSKGFGKILIH